MGTLVIDWRPVIERQTTATRFAPDLNPLEHRHVRFRQTLDPAPAQQLAVWGCDDGLSYRVAVRTHMSDRSPRGHHVRFRTALAGNTRAKSRSACS